jgi:hypothetical protein
VCVALARLALAETLAHDVGRVEQRHHCCTSLLYLQPARASDLFVPHPARQTPLAVLDTRRVCANVQHSTVRSRVIARHLVRQLSFT